MSSLTRFLLLCCLCGVLALFSGCATKPGTLSGIERPAALASLPDDLARRAEALEARGEAYRALTTWRLTERAADPGSPLAVRAKAQADRLDTELAAQAQSVLKKAEELAAKGKSAAAERAYLAVLAKDPANEAAVAGLRGLGGADSLRYAVVEGDTPESIAKKVYKDPAAAALVAALAGDALRPGAELLLPPLEDVKEPKVKETAVAPQQQPPTETEPGEDTAAQLYGEAYEDAVPEAPEPLIPTGERSYEAQVALYLQEANTAYAKRNYKATATSARKAAALDPENETALELKNASLYLLGQELLKQEDYKSAVENFIGVDSGYKDVDTVLARTRKLIGNEHYQRGVKYFVEENLTAAMHEFELTLEWYPGHPQAQRDIDKVRTLQRKLEGF